MVLALGNGCGILNGMKDRNRFPSPFCARLGIGLAVCALSGLSAAPVRAADDKPPAVAPRAGELLKRMGDYLAQAQFFSVHAEVWQDVRLSSGQLVQAGRTIYLAVRRPDCLRAEARSTRRNRDLLYDGSAITLLNRDKGFYGTVRASGPLDDAMDLACERFGITMPLEDFLRSNPARDFLENVTAGLDLGAVTVLGVPCEHVAFTQDNIDWQLWIEQGPRPVPRKFLITYKDEPDSPQFTALFSNWDFTTKLPDFLFKFEPPAGASKIKVKEIRAENQARKQEEK